MTGSSRNGREPAPEDDVRRAGTDAADRTDPDEDEDEDLPLDEAEAAMGAAAAGDVADESLDERVGTVCDELGEVTRTPDADLELLAVRGRVFAVVGADLLEVALHGPIAQAALATSDTRPSLRGAGWVTFTPAVTDRFALDRAEAWVRYAHRRATERADQT